MKYKTMDVILWYSSIGTVVSIIIIAATCAICWAIYNLQMETLSYAEFIKLSFGNIRKYEYTYVSVGEEVYQLWEVEVRRKDNTQPSFLSILRNAPPLHSFFLFQCGCVNLVGRFPLLDSSVFAPFQWKKYVCRDIRKYIHENHVAPNRSMQLQYRCYLLSNA